MGKGYTNTSINNQDGKGLHLCYICAYAKSVYKYSLAYTYSYLRKILSYVHLKFFILRYSYCTSNSMITFIFN